MGGDGSNIGTTTPLLTSTCEKLALTGMRVDSLDGYTTAYYFFFLEKCEWGQADVRRGGRAGVMLEEIVGAGGELWYVPSTTHPSLHCYLKSLEKG